MHLSTLAEVRERVLEHVNVLARPLVLQREKHPIVWTPVYANITVSSRKLFVVNSLYLYEFTTIDILNPKNVAGSKSSGLFVGSTREGRTKRALYESTARQKSVQLRKRTRKKMEDHSGKAVKQRDHSITNEPSSRKFQEVLVLERT